MTESEREVLHLQQKDEEQQAEIDALRQQIEALEERLERLEGGPAMPLGYVP